LTKVHEKRIAVAFDQPAIALSFEAQAQRKSEVQQRPLVFTHATVLDMTGAAAKSDMTVVVAHGRITAVGKSSHIRMPKNARVVDAKGQFLIPGLWDMHVHIFNNSSRSIFNNSLRSVGTNNKDWYFPL
jgi:imidazolonepropionase-like amidohydrolase